MKRLRRILRWGICLLLGGAVVGLALYMGWKLEGPALQPWHHWHPSSAFKVGAADDLAGYLRLEEQQFRELSAFLGGLTTSPISRYARDNELARRVTDHDWNRTVELPVPSPRGAVLLLHGMSDSPYSMRSLALAFQHAGYHALALRLPGHGTVPAGIARARWQDMAAAVRLAVKHLRRQAPAAPLVLVGYSNGAALALEYALAAPDEGHSPPAALVLLSPAIAVTPAARLSRLFMHLGRLPGLHQLEWLNVQPEYDPYKYNSFPVNAGYQVYALSRRVQALLDARTVAGSLASFPPVLVVQSAVDSTVSAPAVLSQLMSRLESGRDEVLVFDVNRDAHIVDLFPAGTESLEPLLCRPAPYGFSLVTNRDPDHEEVRLVRRAPGSSRVTTRDLHYRWPRGIYSLSHVALPFPPDDPVYGRGSDDRPTLGGVELRGENGVLQVPLAQLLRLRYNPFYRYVEQRVLAFVEQAVPAQEEPALAKSR